MRLFARKRREEQENIHLVSPVTGTAIEMSEVPDPVFSQSILGPGFAVLPKDDEVVAPAGGTITSVADTSHAVYLTDPQGSQILVHLGLETVKLNGQYFQLLVSEGQEVQPGDPIARCDFAAIRAAGYQTPVLVCLINGAETVSDFDLAMLGEVVAGQAVASARRTDR